MRPEKPQVVTEDDGLRSKQTMTVIVAVYLPDSPLHIHVVSIPCHVCQQLITIRAVVWQDSRIAASIVQSQLTE